MSNVMIHYATELLGTRAFRPHWRRRREQVFRRAL